MEDSLFQIIFLALALVGWIIKTAIEERERRKQGRKKAPPRETPRSEGPHLPREELPYPAPRPPPPPTPAPVPAPSQPARASRAPSLKEIQPALQVIRRARLPGRGETLVAETERSRLRALGRLAGAPQEGFLGQVRAGILWVEVLGPCRALRGPHRPPASERSRR